MKFTISKWAVYVTLAVLAFMVAVPHGKAA